MLLPRVGLSTRQMPPESFSQTSCPGQQVIYNLSHMPNGESMDNAKPNTQHEQQSFQNQITEMHTQIKNMLSAVAHLKEAVENLQRTCNDNSIDIELNRDDIKYLQDELNGMNCLD
jgi:peptidoglycan hydrolase CwlO-like protein